LQRGLQPALCLNSRMRQIEGDLGNPQAGTALEQGQQTIGREGQPVVFSHGWPSSADA
jgi:hypothetical protein